MSTTESTHPQDGLFTQVDEYDWDNDAEFQGGLRAILGSAQSPEQIAHLKTRARCFYYSKKFGTKVDFPGYQAWQANRYGSVANGTNGEATADAPTETEEAASSEPVGNAPTPATFAEICALIAEGKPIPGIKEIPDTILEGQATTSNVARRKKPWEKDEVTTVDEAQAVEA